MRDSRKRPHQGRRKLSSVETTSFERAMAACASDGCDKPGTMACPTCQKLGSETLFCNQQCFTRSWTSHKRTHKSLKPKPLAAQHFGGDDAQRQKQLHPSQETEPRMPASQLESPKAHQLPQGAATGQPLTNPSSGALPAIAAKLLQRVRRKTAPSASLSSVVGGAVHVTPGAGDRQAYQLQRTSVQVTTYDTS